MIVVSVCLPSDTLSQHLLSYLGFSYLGTPGSVGARYASGDQWRNNSRKNEGMEPKQKQHPVVDVTGDGSKV